MEVIKTTIEGLLIIRPRVFEDARGYFFESYSQRDFEAQVGKVNFVQDNESMSSYGVMRGLHFQRPPYTQCKLVRCVKGTVLDVAVDIMLRWNYLNRTGYSFSFLMALPMASLCFQKPRSSSISVIISMLRRQMTAYLF